jgi:hypothetical protein
MIEYRFRVPSAAVFTLYSYSKALEYLFRVPNAASLMVDWWSFVSYDHPCPVISGVRESTL